MQSETSVRLRVLYLDDDESVRRAVARALGRHFDVDAVSDAKGAEAAIQAARYDAFITDLQMPQVDGFAMIRRVAGIDARLARRAVILTGVQFTRHELEDFLADGFVIVEKSAPTKEIVAAVLLRVREEP